MGARHSDAGGFDWQARAGIHDIIADAWGWRSRHPHGYEAVEGKMHINDWHATILHLLGLDHEKLTYRYAGRDFRLTNVAGKVADEILT